MTEECLSLSAFKIQFQNLIEKFCQNQQQQSRAIEYAIEYLQQYHVHVTSQRNQDHDQDQDRDYEYETETQTRVKTRPLPCPMCDKVFDLRLSLLRHVIQHNGTRLSCRICKLSFHNHVGYYIHKASSLCRLAALDDAAGNFFAINRNIVLDEADDYLRMCPFCATKFSKSFNLKRHMKRICDAADSPGTDTVRVKYFMTASSRYRCKPCSLDFPTRSSYRKHVKLFRGDRTHEEKNAGAYRCEECGENFRDRDSLKKHYGRLKHAARVRSVTKSIICDKCGSSFFTDADLNTHVNRTHGDYYKCDLCPYKCKTLENINAHTCSDSTQRTLMCHRCPAVFKTSSALNAHIHTVHSQVRKFACNICNKSFKVNSQLTRHKATHDASSAIHVCPYCSAAFHRGSHLTRHVTFRHRDHNILSDKVDADGQEQVFSIMSEQLLTLSSSADPDIFTAPQLWT